MTCLNRRQLRILPLAERHSKLDIEHIAVFPDAEPPAISPEVTAQVKHLAARIRTARAGNKPVMLTFGAHLIKNGLAPLMIRLLENGWVTHVATNGAGSIHDWEFAYQRYSTEDVRANTAQGQFGTWEETGRYVNLAVAVGGPRGLGYGASVGKMIAENGLEIPSRKALRWMVTEHAGKPSPTEILGALADLLYLVVTFDLPAGWLPLAHSHARFSIQAAAHRLGIPFTVHPGIGYDIIYTHPMNCGGAIGRGAVTDFLTYAGSVSQLSGGVHLTIGSAIMAPMIFEKSLSMANNLALQHGPALSDYYLVVNDIQPGGNWDWRTGEPPMDHPAYYLRFCKTFYRMGGELDYIGLDNRAFLLALYHELQNAK